MARVKRSVAARKKRRKVLEQAKGYVGIKHSTYRAAKEQVEHSLKYAYRDRKARKRDMRRLWIIRINAARAATGCRTTSSSPAAARRGSSSTAGCSPRSPWSIPRRSGRSPSRRRPRSTRADRRARAGFSTRRSSASAAARRSMPSFAAASPLSRLCATSSTTAAGTARCSCSAACTTSRSRRASIRGATLWLCSRRDATGFGDSSASGASRRTRSSAAGCCCRASSTSLDAPGSRSSISSSSGRVQGQSPLGSVPLPVRERDLGRRGRAARCPARSEPVPAELLRLQPRPPPQRRRPLADRPDAPGRHAAPEVVRLGGSDGQARTPRPRSRDASLGASCARARRRRRAAAGPAGGAAARCLTVVFATAVIGYVGKEGHDRIVAALEEAGRQFPLAYLWTARPRPGEHGHWGLWARLLPDGELCSRTRASTASGSSGWMRQSDHLAVEPAASARPPSRVPPSTRPHRTVQL